MSNRSNKNSTWFKRVFSLTLCKIQTTWIFTYENKRPMLWRLWSKWSNFVRSSSFYCKNYETVIEQRPKALVLEIENFDRVVKTAFQLSRGAFREKIFNENYKFILCSLLQNTFRWGCQNCVLRVQKKILRVLEKDLKIFDPTCKILLKNFQRTKGLILLS